MRRLMPGFALLLAALAFGLWALPPLPARVASHWALSGQPDGTMGRAAAAVFLPLFGAVLGLVFAVVPRLDPRKDQLLHAGVWWTIANAVLALLAVLHVALLGYNLGWPVPMAGVTLVAIGLLFILLGYLMPRMRSNWFMGIRTPWTLTSDAVWRSTHAVAGRLFAAAGAVFVVLGFMQPPHLMVMAAVVIAVAVGVPVAWSYLAWRREQERAGVSGSA